MIYYSLLLPLSPPPYLETTIHMRTNTQRTTRKQDFMFLDRSCVLNPRRQATRLSVRLSSHHKSGIGFSSGVSVQGVPHIDAVESEDYSWARSMRGLDGTPKSRLNGRVVYFSSLQSLGAAQAVTQ